MTATPHMSNDELAQAIEVTNTLVRATGTAEATYMPLANHLKSLLDLQVKRAQTFTANRGGKHE